ncbi:MAG: hypothetical protein DME22_04275 [Verrucomicrobia bacterium]|nr:MAG: hypothetical protein DME22_04275 [Verrucomicrobiota bacterium]
MRGRDSGHRWALAIAFKLGCQFVGLFLQHLRPTAQFGQFVPLAVRRALRLSDPIGKLFSFCDQLGQLLVLPAEHPIVFAHLRLGVEVEDQGYCQTDGDSGDD